MAWLTIAAIHVRCRLKVARHSVGIRKVAQCAPPHFYSAGQHGTNGLMQLLDPGSADAGSYSSGTDA